MISRKSARDKGTRWNRTIAEYLAAEGWPHAETRAKNGVKDRGDVTGIAGVMIEAKNVAQPRLGQFVGEVTVQTINADALIGVVWLKSPGMSSAAEGVVAMSPGTLLKLGFTGDIVGECSLPSLLDHPQLLRWAGGECSVILKPYAWAAITGATFVKLLKEGGW